MPSRVLLLVTALPIVALLFGALPDADAQTAEDWVGRGLEFEEKGDMDSALDAYSRAIERKPDLLHGYLFRSMIHFDRKDYERAIEDASVAIRLDVNDEHRVAYDVRGRSLYQLKRYEEAIPDLTAVLEKKPDLGLVVMLRGGAHLELKRWSDAMRDFNAAVRLLPDDPLPYTYRALVYGQWRQFGQAFANVERALHLDPRYPFALHVRAALIQRSGQKRDLTAEKDIAAEAYLNRGMLRAKEDKQDEAFRLYTRAIELGTRFSAPAHYNRAIVHERRRQFRRAIDDYSEAIRLSPEFAKAYLNRGFIYAERLEDFDRARLDWKAAARLDPDGGTGDAARDNLRALKAGS